MSPKLCVLSGDQVLEIFHCFGFEVVGQKGSHIKIARQSGSGQREVLLIPNHKSIATGTLRAIIRQASAYIPRAELEQHFRG